MDVLSCLSKSYLYFSFFNLFYIKLFRKIPNASEKVDRPAKANHCKAFCVLENLKAHAGCFLLDKNI